MKKIPVNIVSGFLGSGKTTAIINLLKNKPEHEKWAIIINEFGKISIDGQTYKSNSETGNVFEINGGCICCSAIQYLGKTFDNIIRAEIYDRIIIEPSGLGGLDMILEIANSNTNLVPQPVICMVDLCSVANKRLQMNLIYQNQINSAKLIVFSKADSLSKENKLIAIKLFSELFPEKKNIIFNDNIDHKIFDFDEPDIYSNVKPGFKLYENLSDSDYQQTSFRFEPSLVFDENKIKLYFDENNNIVRAKGYLNTNNGWKLINSTYSGVSSEISTEKLFSEIVIITSKTDLKPINDIKEDLIKKTAYI